MANKHMKRCLTFSSHQGMANENPNSIPHHTNSVALILETDNNNCGTGCGNTGAFVPCRGMRGGGNGNWYSHSEELWPLLRHLNRVAI